MSTESLTPKMIADSVNIPYLQVLALLKSGAIPGMKEKNKWVINAADFEGIQKSNAIKVQNLRDHLVSLYWQGCGIKSLDGTVRDMSEAMGILLYAPGFAERTIYEHVMAEKGVDKNG